MCQELIKDILKYREVTQHTKAIRKKAIQAELTRKCKKATQAELTRKCKKATQAELTRKCKKAIRAELTRKCRKATQAELTRKCRKAIQVVPIQDTQHHRKSVIRQELIQVNLLHNSLLEMYM
jgi:hypothetical protein